MSRIVTIANESLSVDISTRGAELWSIRTPDNSEWLWQGDARFWAGRAPVLFPVIGRSPGGHVLIDGMSFPMNSHGFARDSEFIVRRQTPVSCVMELTASAITRKHFPFDFSLKVAFILSEAILSVQAIVTNESSIAMPFCIGFHPAFRWPMPGADGCKHRLVLDAARNLPHRRLDAHGMMTPIYETPLFNAGTLALHPQHFEAGALILERDIGNSIAYRTTGQQEIRMQVTNVTHLGVWSIPGAQFVCIEPWWGSPAVADRSNELRRQAGVQQLDPGESGSFDIAIFVALGN